MPPCFPTSPPPMYPSLPPSLHSCFAYSRVAGVGFPNPLKHPACEIDTIARLQAVRLGRSCSSNSYEVMLSAADKSQCIELHITNNGKTKLAYYTENFYDPANRLTGSVNLG